MPCAGRTAPEPEPIAQPLRFALRATLLTLHLAYGLLLGLVVVIAPDIPRERLGSHWSGLLIRLFGIRLTVHGEPAAFSRLIVANHVSWLDIPLLWACTPTRFVSKSEVEHWPVAGWLANAAGTFYLRRGKNGSRPLLNQIVPYLRAQGSVVIFPEGTTTRGEEVLPFHPRLFCAAIESGRPVQPVALRYGHGTRGEPLAPFIGDDDLVSHVLRLLGNRALDAEVIFGEVLAPAGQSRAALAEAARDAIRAALTCPGAWTGPAAKSGLRPAAGEPRIPAVAPIRTAR